MSTMIKTAHTRSHSCNHQSPPSKRLTLIGPPISSSNMNYLSLNKPNCTQTAHGKGSILIHKNNQLKVEGDLCGTTNYKTSEKSNNVSNNQFYIMPDSSKKNTKTRNENKTERPLTNTDLPFQNMLKVPMDPSRGNTNSNGFINFKQAKFNPFAIKVPKAFRNEKKQHLQSKSFTLPKSHRDNNISTSHQSKSKLNDSNIYVDSTRCEASNSTTHPRSNHKQSRSLTPNPMKKSKPIKERSFSKKHVFIKPPASKNPFDRAGIKQFIDFKNNKAAQPMIYSLYVKKVQQIKLVLNSGIKTKKPSTVVTGTLSGDMSTNATFISRIENKELSNPLTAKGSKEDKKDNQSIGISVPPVTPSQGKEEEMKKIKMEERINLHKEKENKDKGELDFKQLETSPLLLRKKIIDLPEDECKNSNCEENSFILKEIPQNSHNIKIKAGHNNDEHPPIEKTITLMHEFSKIGFGGTGVKKSNQDAYFVFKNFVGNPNHIFMAVCDGHGIVGHEVSSFLKENLPIDLNNAIRARSKNILHHKINGIIEDVFLETNYKLCTNEMIDSTFSGSTCVSLVYTPEKLVCANVGDSRAVLGKCINGEWVSHDLSRDHKPSERDEAMRIKRKGGRIEPFKDEDNEFIGPARIWLKEDDIPGLAMTRSFGDRVASTVGVICEPEITEYKFAEEDKFFIVASDGVWEFIDSNECVNIIKDYYLSKDIVACCEYLHKEASTRWMKEEEVIDDITMILVFLE